MDAIDKLINTSDAIFGGNSVASSVFLLAVVLVIVSLFIFNFYKSTSKRDIIKLDLKKYNYSTHPLMSKFFATIFYFLEYIIILPLLLILWFAGLSIVLMLIAKERPISEVLFISAAMVGTIRILAYFHEEISKDLAKLFPLIALSFFLLSPGDFSFDEFLGHLWQIPLLFNNIFYFILVIFGIEVVLRLFYTVYDIWNS